MLQLGKEGGSWPTYYVLPPTPTDVSMAVAADGRSNREVTAAKWPHLVWTTAPFSDLCEVMGPPTDLEPCSNGQFAPEFYIHTHTQYLGVIKSCKLRTLSKKC